MNTPEITLTTMPRGQQRWSAHAIADDGIVGRDFELTTEGSEQMAATALARKMIDRHDMPPEAPVAWVPMTETITGRNHIQMTLGELASAGGA